MATAKQFEQSPEKPKGRPSESEDTLNNAVEKIRADLSREAKKQIPKQMEPLHVKPSQIMHAVAHEQEKTKKVVPLEYIAKVTQRIPYEELGSEW